MSNTPGSLSSVQYELDCIRRRRRDASAIQNLVAGDLNSVGLILGFIGVLLIFFFGLPPVGVLNEGAYVATEMTPRMEKYLLLSRLGLLLVAAGFLCQFLAVRQA